MFSYWFCREVRWKPSLSKDLATNDLGKVLLQMLLLTASSWKSSLELRVLSDVGNIQETPPQSHMTYEPERGPSLHSSPGSPQLVLWPRLDVAQNLTTNNSCSDDHLPSTHCFTCVLFKKKIFFAMPCSMWDLSSPTRDRNPCPCSASVSLNRWTAWEVPPLCSFVTVSFCYLWENLLWALSM